MSNASHKPSEMSSKRSVGSNETQNLPFYKTGTERQHESRK